MKMAFVFCVLLAGLVNGLAAQTSASNFIVLEATHLGTDPTRTLGNASDVIQPLISIMRENLPSVRFIQEKTRMEEQLVSRARQELPNNPSGGSFWAVLMSNRYGSVIYFILFFASQNGQVYHWMYHATE